jgi:hypothetical protein
MIKIGGLEYQSNAKGGGRGIREHPPLGKFSDIAKTRPQNLFDQFKQSRFLFKTNVIETQLSDGLPGQYGTRVIQERTKYIFFAIGIALH